MPRWRSVWLVARREILERGRSRGFLLSVAFTTLIVVGSFVIPAIAFGGDNPVKVGVVEPSPPGLGAAIEQSAERFVALHYSARANATVAGCLRDAIDAGFESGYEAGDRKTSSISTW